MQSTVTSCRRRCLFAGACEGTLSCSTCHLIFEKKDFDALPTEAGEEEMDMLDLAYELTDTYAG